eukprot:300824_1
MSNRPNSSNSDSGLRNEWLHTLKKKDLKILCQNRDIHTEKSSKPVIIKMLLKSKQLTVKEYEKLTKALLSLELKAKGIEYSDKAVKTELIKLLNKNKKKKFTNDTLSDCKLSELQQLCQSRSIETQSINSKQKLIETLKNANMSDPRFTPMKSKQLMAEMKGRGLNTNKMNMAKMLEILKSGSSYEHKKLESHINNDNVDNIIQNTEDKLRNFIKYMKENKEKIKTLTNQNIANIKAHKNRDYLLKSEWNKFEQFLRNARDEIIDLRTMIEIYADADLGKDEDLPQNKHFTNVIDSSDDQTQTVYVVYDDDEDLIMDQNKDAILGLFHNESDAEKYKKQLSANDNVSIHMQEIVVNDYNGAQ